MNVKLEDNHYILSVQQTLLEITQYSKHAYLWVSNFSGHTGHKCVSRVLSHIYIEFLPTVYFCIKMRKNDSYKVMVNSLYLISFLRLLKVSLHFLGKELILINKFHCHNNLVGHQLDTPDVYASLTKCSQYKI